MIFCETQLLLGKVVTSPTIHKQCLPKKKEKLIDNSLPHCDATLELKCKLYKWLGTATICHIWCEQGPYLTMLFTGFMSTIYIYKWIWPKPFLVIVLMSDIQTFIYLDIIKCGSEKLIWLSLASSYHWRVILANNLQVKESLEMENQSTLWVLVIC
jgi:hypothetical protein